MLRPFMTSVLVGVLLVGVAAPVFAQSTTGMTSSGFGTSSSGGGISGSSGSFGSSSSGSFGSSSSGSSSSGSFSGGGFTGSSSTNGGTTSGGQSGSTSYGTTSFQGKYYGNPLYNGVPTSPGTGSQYLRTFPEQLGFGSTLYNSTSSGTTGRTGTTGTSGTSGTATVTTSSFPGATTSGIRRAPAYISEPVFDRPVRPTSSAVQSDLQNVVARSSRLPSRDRIKVSVDGTVVILSGQVRDERERRLAEMVVKLTPGVRDVKNLLLPTKQSP